MALAYRPDDERAHLESPAGEVPERISFQAEFDLDSSYPSGGYSIPDDFTKLKELFETLKHVTFSNTQGKGFWYDETNQKIRVYILGGCQVDTGGDLSGITGVHMKAEGWR